MHDHDFEKQVHQKMEELHLNPSYTVWDRVEEKLRKKKRRRILFWIPFLLTGLFTGGYYLAQNHTAVRQQHTLSSNLNPSSHSPKESAHIKPMVTAGNPGKRAVPVSGSLPPVPVRSAGARMQRQISSAAVLQSTSRLPTYHNKDTPAGKNNEREKPETAVNISPDERKGSFSLVKNDEDTSDSGAFKNPVIAIPSVLQLHTPVLTTFSIYPGEEKADRTIKLKKTKDFHWGVNLEILRTSVNDGSLGKVFKSASMADQLAANLTSANNSGGGVLVPSTPSAIRAGTGFSAGFFLQKRLGSRWTVSTGISYTLFNTSVMIGSSRNSSAAQFNSSGVDRYYSLTNGGDSRKYTNSYHFAGVPVLFQVRLTGGKVPVLWEGGGLLSRLIASNALQYSNSLNGYYQDNRLLIHTQFSVLTGLQVKIFPYSSHPVSAGPQLQVGLSSLSTGSTGNRTHLAQYGLKISALIK